MAKNQRATISINHKKIGYTFSSVYLKRNNKYTITIKPSIFKYFKYNINTKNYEGFITIDYIGKRPVLIDKNNKYCLDFNQANIDTILKYQKHYIIKDSVKIDNERLKLKDKM